MISTPHAGARPPDVDGAREWMSICYRSARPPGAQSLPFILRGAGKSRWQLITKLL